VRACTHNQVLGLTSSLGFEFVVGFKFMLGSTQKVRTATFLKFQLNLGSYRMIWKTCMKTIKFMLGSKQKVRTATFLKFQLNLGSYRMIWKTCMKTILGRCGLPKYST